MSLVQTASNEQIDRAQQAALPVEPNTLTVNLASHVRSLWIKAYTAKKLDVQTKLYNNALQFNTQYEPSVLAAIKTLKGSEQYISLTATKCNATIASLTDIFDKGGTGGNPWDISPTPIPEIPAELEAQIRDTVLSEVSQIIGQYAKATKADPETLLASLMPQIRKRIRNRIMKAATDAVDEVKIFIEDQLVEGGWYEAVIQCIFDLVVYKAGILKGPIYRKVKRLKRVLSEDGTYENSVEDRVIPMFERRSPFKIFPAPDASSINDTYMCDLDSLSIKQLSDLRGVDGFDAAAITIILNRYKSGGLREWATYDTAMQEAETGGNKTMSETDKIDTVEFHGPISGGLLKEWGMDGIEDEAEQYDVTVWLIGNEVIKAMLNPDPMGKKPYSMRSYIEIPGSVWGRGLSEIIADLQQICNAMTRAIVNNAGIASGPLVEYNGDRMPPGFDQTIYPWKSITSSGSSFSDSAPAVRFYQPKIVIDQLIRVFDYFSKLADQYSIPSYAHGSAAIGGAGKTASGLRQLTQMSSKVIQNVVRNIDGMIEESLSLLYIHNIFYNADKFSFVGDVKIKARGTSIIMQREEQAVRRMEFLERTNNPADLNLVGPSGRREMLKEVADGLNINNLSKIFPEIDEIDGLRQELVNMMAAQEERDAATAKGTGTGTAAGAAPKKRISVLDSSGAPVSGQDNREFPQKSVEQ